MNRCAAQAVSVRGFTLARLSGVGIPLSLHVGEPVVLVLDTSLQFVDAILGRRDPG